MLQHPVPPNLLVHFGDITVSFALLEDSLQHLVFVLIGDFRTGQIITAELSFKNLRALLISLYKERHGENVDFPALRELVKRAAQAEETRNQITHSIWAAGDAADRITRIKTTAKESRGFHFHAEGWSESDLAKVALELKTLAGDIQAFWIDLLEDSQVINNSESADETKPA